MCRYYLSTPEIATASIVFEDFDLFNDEDGIKVCYKCNIGSFPEQGFEVIRNSLRNLTVTIAAFVCFEMIYSRMCLKRYLNVLQTRML